MDNDKTRLAAEEIIKLTREFEHVAASDDIAIVAAIIRKHVEGEAAPAPQAATWNELVEQIRTEHNGVFVVELFMGHDGHNVCRFKDYDKVIGEGESGKSMQEAVERCIAAWKLEKGASWFARNPE